MRKLKLCFAALAAHPVLSQANTPLIGGAELQQTFLARTLAANNDFDVCFIVYDHGQPPVEILDGIKLLKTAPPQGNYLLKAYKVWKALKQANADVYYQRGTGGLTAMVAFFCLRHKKKFIHSIASDMGLNFKHKRPSALLHKFGIQRADVVIAQTQQQQEHLPRPSVVIKSAFILPPKTKPEKTSPPAILWVGTMKRQAKQPELFLELAKAIPEAKFQMIGGPAIGEEQYFDYLKETALGIPNLDFLGFIPREKIAYYFARASILVNSSIIEGFPNTFLEAWVSYTPVVSLNVDPDEVICRHKLGFHSRNFEQMVEDVKTLLNDKELRGEMGGNGRRYVEQEHDIQKIATQYVRLLKSLADTT